MIVCGFFTDGKYKEWAKRLRKDCQRLGIGYFFTNHGVQDFIADKPDHVTRRNWICRYKPRFILMAMEVLDDNILYMDVDNRILRKPELRHVNVAPVAYGRRCENKYDVSALFFRNTARAENFLKTWQIKCEYTELNTADHIYFITTAMEFRRVNNKMVRPFSLKVVSKNAGDNPIILHK